MKEIETLAEQLRAKNTMMDELAARGDYTGAAAAQQEIKATEEQIMEKFAPKNDFAEAAAAQAVAHEMKTHEEQLAALKKTMDELAAKKDFRGAAAAKAEVLELEERLSVMAARAKATGPAKLKASDLLEEQIRSKTQIMNELASKKDFAGAAAAQVEVDVLTKSRSATTAVMPPLTSSGSGTHSDPRGGRSAQRGAGSGTAPVSLEKLRVLSSSKLTQVPARNPRK